MSDPVQDVTAAVAALEEALPGLLAACTDPEATDMAELFADVQAARKKLQDLERDLETTTAKAMVGDQAVTGTLRVDRSRRPDRKAWQHDEWKRDVRAHALQAFGLKGAQGVINAAGEVLEAAVLGELLDTVTGVHGSAPPRVTQMRGLGLDPDDYCERSPGTWRLDVTRMADESTDDETESEGSDDAAA